MATMQDVARRAGVSGATVSHVVNNTRPVSEETRRRVEHAIRMTGYRHNSLARALAAGRTNTIGLCVPILTNPYIADLVNAIETAAGAEGYVLLLGDSRDEPSAEAAAVRTFLEHRVDGVIMAPGIDSAQTTIPQIRESGTPLTVIDRHVSDVECDQVFGENIDSVQLLTTHMLDHGHESLLVLRGSPGIRSTDERFAGFLATAESRGLAPSRWSSLVGGANSAATTAALLEHFAHQPLPDAVITLNNAMTIGAMRAFRELGIRVPDDVALGAFDDFEWADLFAPRLTALSQDVSGMGRRAVEMLLSRISHPHGDPAVVCLPTTFHVRDSCGTHA